MIAYLLVGVLAVCLAASIAIGLRWRWKLRETHKVLVRTAAEKRGLVGLLQRVGVHNVTTTWTGDDLHLHGEWIPQGRREGRA